MRLDLTDVRLGDRLLLAPHQEPVLGLAHAAIAKGANMRGFEGRQGTLMCDRTLTIVNVSHENPEGALPKAWPYKLRLAKPRLAFGHSKKNLAGSTAALSRYILQRRPVQLIERVLRNHAMLVERCLKPFAEPGQAFPRKLDGRLSHVCQSRIGVPFTARCIALRRRERFCAQYVHQFVQENAVRHRPRDELGVMDADISWPFYFHGRRTMSEDVASSRPSWYFMPTARPKM